MPFLLWAAVRFGFVGASTSILAVVLVAIWGTAHGQGPFSSRSRRSIICQSDLQPGLPLVKGNTAQLQQVLLNLVINSMDALMNAHKSQRLLKISTTLATEGGVEVHGFKVSYQSLTARQREVFKGIVAGKLNKQIVAISVLPNGPLRRIAQKS